MPAPTVYYPIPRRPQADKTGDSHAIGIRPADKQPPSVTRARESFSYERKYGAKFAAYLPVVPPPVPPSVVEVSAFSYERIFGGKTFGFRLAPTAAAPTSPNVEKVTAHNPAGPVPFPWSKLDAADVVEEVTIEQKTRVTLKDQIERTLFSQAWGGLTPTVVAAAIPYTYKTIGYQDTSLFGAAYTYGLPLAEVAIEYKTRVEAAERFEKILRTTYISYLPGVEEGVAYQTYAKAFDLPQALLGTRFRIGYRDAVPPEIHEVQAFTLDLPYGGKSHEIVAVSAYAPEYHSVVAHDPQQALLGTRVYWKYADLRPPQVERVEAFSLPQNLLGTRYELAYRDFAPPFVEVVSAHNPTQLLLGTRAYAAYRQLAPPERHRVEAIELVQHLLETRALPAYLDYAPEVHKVSAFDLPQHLLDTRWVTPYADVVSQYPPEVHSIQAFTDQALFGASYVYGLPIPDIQYPAETHYVQAFDLQQLLLGTRAYWKYADNVPPETHKVTAHNQVLEDLEAPLILQLLVPEIDTYPITNRVRAHDPEQLRNTRIYSAYRDLAPPETHKVTAIEITQRLLESRVYRAYADAAPQTFKAIAVELLQHFLDTRAYPAYRDYAPPETHKIQAHTFDYRYGGRPIYIPFSVTPVDYFTPGSYRVKQDIEVPQALLGTRVYWKYADRVPPQVERVTAFDYEQLRNTRIYPAYRDYAPPETHRVTAIEPVQHLLDTRPYLAYSDPVAPEVHRVQAFDLPQALLGTRVEFVTADRYPPETHKIQAHTFDYRYGGETISIPFSVTPVDYFTPGVYYAKQNIEALQVLLGTRAYWKYADYAPPSVTRVAAFELAQRLLETRDYQAYADLAPQVYKSIAIELVQHFLDTRAYPAYKDLAPPEVHKIDAFSYDRRYGANASGVYLPVGLLAAIPPYTYKVVAIEPLQHMLDTRPYLAYRDYAPPETHKVQAFDLEQKPLLTRYYVVRADAPIPYSIRVREFTLPQKEAETYYYVVYADRQPPSVQRVQAHDPVQHLLDTRFVHYAIAYVTTTFANPWESLVGIDVVGTEPWESLQGIDSTWIEPYESLIGISSTWSDPWEALGAVQSTYINPFEARGWVTNDLVLPYEALVALQRTDTVPFETLLSAALTSELPWEAVSQLVAEHLYEALMFAHYHGMMFKHMDARMYTHIATEAKRHIDAMFFKPGSGRPRRKR